MLCKGMPPGEGARVQVAKLRADGGLTTCTQTEADPVCFQGDLGSPVPHFRPGRKVKVGPFACTVLETRAAAPRHPAGASASAPQP